ncbi:hypothetical protein OKA04_02285 [Luteolibacter flavescens]|uniref:Cytochrome C Planctomycete-type domain-containing protein n=1 Tax=Luteolibacter flavescens TaxID=1859460 RepID=A0ABT3FJA0_9BACT|nr:c-type cytochrome domain-containing protein [Luteolibacter flavescens]MCW1883537.1 hypothetical protein [Luteolibacter flavescens]
MTDSETPRRSSTGPIFLTLCGLLVIAALASVPFVAGAPTEEGLPDITKFLGRFHPVFLHLPIGMLLLVLVLEIGHFIPRNRAGYSTRMAMFFAAASSVVATILGLLLYYGTGNYRDELAERHLYGGIIFACGMVAAFIVKVWVDFHAGKGTWIYWTLLIGSTGVMGIASHDGGSLTHGEDYLTAFAPNPIRKAMGLPEKVEKKEKPKPTPAATDLAATGTGEAPAGTPAAPAPVSTDPVVYTNLIVPIFEQKCYSCHSAEQKVRGKYRMEEYDLLLKGGSEGEGIVPGNSADSNVVVRIELPSDDEEHMPPPEKKDIHLVDHEVLLIKWWIDSGASPEAKLSDLKPTDEIKAAITKLVPAEDLAEKKATAAAEEKQEAEKRDSVAADVERLRKEFPAALNFESQASSGLVFTAVSMRKEFGDDDLAKLQPVIPAMVSIDLSSSTVTDTGTKLLAEAAELKTLRLSETAITDAALDELAKLPKLESLNLYGTQVTNDGILKLAELKNLKKLYLWQTKVDAAGVQALKEKLPGCEVIMGL